MFNLLLTRSPDAPLRVLLLGAHSDDIEIGCGGTVLSLLSQCDNVSARWVVFSANEVRAREAEVSADAFLAGAAEKRVSVLDYRDGFFPFVGDQIKDEFEAIKRDFQPDVIFTHYRDDRHQDHRVISDLTWNTFRNHLIFEYEIPKYDGDLGRPNCYVTLDEQISSEKVRLLMESFASQRAKQWFDEETFLALMRLRGLEAAAATRYAEAFYSRKAVLGFSREESIDDVAYTRAGRVAESHSREPHLQSRTHPPAV